MAFRPLFIILTALLLVSCAGFAQSVDPWQEYFPQGLLDGEGKEITTDLLKGKYVGIYFSAAWCSSCQAFSPKLVPFRNQHADEFEVVFVSSDKNEAAQFAYMKDYGMLWPTMKYKSAAANALKAKYEIKTIPTLVIVSPTGQFVTREGRFDVQNDPEGAMAKWKAIQALSQPGAGAIPVTD